jgi:hypothetical protein
MKVFHCHFSYENSYGTLTTRDFVVVEKDAAAALDLVVGKKKEETEYWTVTEINTNIPKAHWISITSSR